VINQDRDIKKEIETLDIQILNIQKDIQQQQERAELDAKIKIDLI
jgi:hypothetical protein